MSSQSSRSPSTTLAQPAERELQPPIRSSRVYGWKNISVEEFHQPPGQETYHSPADHTLCLSLNQRPSRLLQKMGDRRHTSLFARGDLSIAPAGVPLFSQWQQEDQYVRIRLASEFLEHVAHEAIASRGGTVLAPEFRTRNLEIEQISMMLLNELYSEGASGSLYVESLTTVLAVHVLKNYSVTQPCVALQDVGLSEYQRLQVIDYIGDRLADEIHLSDLAELLDMSPFHFSRLFKQSMGVSPYQYLLQQRVERAKQLLKTTDLSIMEIALRCGFSSHSHLGKWFRQHTGVTPKVFRLG